MRKGRFFLLTLLLFISALSFKSQEHLEDTLLNVSYDKMVGDLPKYENFYLSLIPVYEAENKPLSKAKAFEKLSIIYHLNNDFEKSIYYGTEAANLYELEGEIGLQAAALGSLGFSLKSFDFEQGKKYMLESIKIAEIVNDSSILSPLYNNYGLFKKDQNQYDSAIYYYLKSLNIDQARNDSVGLPYVFDHIGEIYLLEEKYNEAFTLFSRSYEIRLIRNDVYGIVDSELYLGDLYFGKGDYNQAKKYYESARKKSRENNILILYKYTLGQLSEIAKAENDFKTAFIYSEELTKIKDSLLNDSRNKEIARLQVKFDTEKKERDLLASKLNLAKEEQKNTALSFANERRLIWLITISGIAFLIVVVVFFVIRNLRRKRAHDLKEFHLKELIAAEKAEKQMAEEKVRVSRELHDNIGARITFLITSMDNLTYRKIDDVSKQKLYDLADFGRNTMDDLRNTVWAMKMENGTVGDLVDRILGIKQFVNASFNVDLQVERNVRLTAIQLLNMYRIVQEATQNAVKYSSCTSINVKLELQYEQLVLSITDDGIGFNSGEIKMGNGLRNMKHRCEECGGEFELQSLPSSGTKIVCKLKS